MSTMRVSLSESMKAFVDEQVAQRGYGTSSEYVRDLILREQEREKLRGLLLEGLESGAGRAVDAAWFEELHRGIRRRAAPAKRRRAVKAPSPREQ
jgi:antitoxin ParD1/3/4